MKLTDVEIARFAQQVEDRRLAPADPGEASSFAQLVAARRLRVGRPRG